MRLFSLADAGDDAGFATNFQETIRPMITAFVEPFTAETTAQAAQGESRAAEGAANARAAMILVAVTLTVGILASGLLAFFVTRAILRDVRRVQKATDRLAQGDLLATTGVTSGDEIGRMAQALDAAILDVRSVMSSVVGSADGVAAASEEPLRDGSADRLGRRGDLGAVGCGRSLGRRGVAERGPGGRRCR